MNVVTTLKQFDEFLFQRGESFSAVVIGGAALNVMSIIQRETIDVDCLEPAIPETILVAASEFRKSFPQFGLIEKWINNGPESLLKELEAGWRSRTVEIYRGKALHFSSLGRLDLIKTKLFAYCDRDTDLQDCIALKPTEAELNDCIAWVSYRDANPMWPKNVKIHFERLRKHLGYGK